MSVSNFREIYDRHRGPFWLLLTRETPTKKGAEQMTDRVDGPLSADDAHEEARILVHDLKDTVVDVFVFSISEGQFIGALYRRGETYAPWSQLPATRAEMRMELPDQREAPVLVCGQKKPVQEVAGPLLLPGLPEGAISDDGSLQIVSAEEQSHDGAEPRIRHQAPRPQDRVPSSKKLPGDRFPIVRGRALELDLGNAERWPRSEAAQLVRTFYADGVQATAAEAVHALGAKLKELGVEHPASLISRLKQAGLLKETQA